MCESGGNYSINLGTGFSGAYQFADSTWSGMGYGGVASQAPPWVQDEAVRQLWRQMGWAPWPGCRAASSAWAELNQQLSRTNR